MLSNLMETYMVNGANWPAPNLINPPVAGHYIPPVQVVLLVLSTLCITLRLGGRLVLKSVGWDDFFIILAWLLGIAVSVANYSAINAGMGLHTWDFYFDLKKARGLLLYMWLSQWAA